MMIELGFNDCDSYIERLQKQADLNGDGLLDFAEFYLHYHSEPLPYWYKYSKTSSETSKFLTQ